MLNGASARLKLKIQDTTPSPMKKKLDRRKFLAVSGAGSGLLWAGCSSPGEEGGQPQGAQTAFQSFSGQDARLLDALGMVILAPQANMPSLQQANLLAYLDQQYASEQQSQQLGQALNGIRQEVALRFGDRQSFEKLDSEQQLGILQTLRQGQGRAEAWQSVSPAQFLNQLRAQLVDGYYGHPLVWKAIGFGGRAQFTGYPDYQQWPETPGQDEG